MPYVNCGHCTQQTPTRLLELANLPMPRCSACHKIVCHLCRPMLENGCRHSNYAEASVILSGMLASKQPVSVSTLKTIFVDVGGAVTSHAYNCPPGAYPPTEADVRDIWSATQGKGLGMKAASNGSGGGKVTPSDSQVFSANAGTKGVSAYGAYDHFHVSIPGYALGSTTRVWYHVDNTGPTVTVKFSQILDK